MSKQPWPKLPIHLGCALAVAIAVVFVAAVALAFWLITDRPFQADEWDFYLFELVIIGAPFAVLALGGTRDWLAWLVGMMLISLVWGWYLYDLSRHTGVNFLLGFVQIVVAPVLISVLSLATAGVRGKLSWDAERDQSA